MIDKGLAAIIYLVLVKIGQQYGTNTHRDIPLPKLGRKIVHDLPLPIFVTKTLYIH